MARMRKEIPKSRPALRKARGALPDCPDLAALARGHAAEAIEVLVALMRNATSDAARRAAAEALIERGWGPAGKAPGETIVVEVVTGIERE